jgi:hypothetical protein
MEHKKENKNLKKESLLKALETSLGIISTACNNVGIGRTTFYRWYKEDEDFKKKVDDIENLKLDYVETQLFKNIQNQDTRSIIFYLQHKGHKRGYIQKQNINLTSNDEDIKKIEIEIIKPKSDSSITKES